MAIGNPISSQNNYRVIRFTATEGQTLFTITDGYAINKIAVYRNGVRLSENLDFTASDATTVTLNDPCQLSDEVVFEILDVFKVAQVGDITGNVTGNLTGDVYAGIVTATVRIDGDLTGSVYGGIVTCTELDVNGNADISGNVTIGGTLTYDDVTNVDSLGIVTAREGVHFGTVSNGTLVVGNSTGIGIGTTNPTAKLDVDGTLNVTGVSTFAGITTVTGSTLFSKQLNVSGISTFDDKVALGSSVYDSNGGTGTDGQVLSSVPGIGVSWTDQTGGSGVATGVTLVQSDTENAFHYVNFTERLTGDEPIRTDSQLRWQPNTQELNLGSGNITLATITSDIFTSSTTGTDGVTIADDIKSVRHINSTGVITALSFSGDGSNLSNLPSVGSGVSVRDNDSPIGFAGTINFGSNLSVSALSAGVVTVTGSSGSSDSYWVQTDVGIHTLSNVGIGTTNPTETLDIDGTLQIYKDSQGHNRLKNGTDQNLRVDLSGTGALEIFSPTPEILFNDHNGGIQTDFSIKVDQGNFTIEDVTSSETVFKYSALGEGVELYCDNAKKLATTGSGVSVTGVLTATKFSGDGSELTGLTGVSAGIDIKDSDSPIGIAGTINFGANLSVTPVSLGVVTVTGSSGSSDSYWVQTDVGIHTLSNVGIGTTNPQNKLEVLGASKLDGNVHIPDDQYLRFGRSNGADMFISHIFGVNTIATGTGTLTFNCGTINFKNGYDSEFLAKFVQNGRVELYYDNTERFETTSVGATVFGDFYATNLYGDGSNISNLPAVGSGVNVKDSDSTVGYAGTINFGSNLSVSALSAGIVTVTASGGGVANAAGSDGQVQYNNGGTSLGGASALYYDDTNNRVGIGTTIPAYELQVGNIGVNPDVSAVAISTALFSYHLGIGHTQLSRTSANPENSDHGAIFTLGATSNKTAYIIIDGNRSSSNDWASVAIGDYRNLANGGPTKNIAIGGKNLFNCTTSGNIAIGDQNLQTLTSSSTANIGIGYQTLNNTTSGSSYNIALGYRSGRQSTSTNIDDNIFIGRSAGDGILSSNSNDNIYIGRGAGVDGTSTQRERNIVIGNVPAVKVGDDQFAIGVDNGTSDNYWLVGDENFNVGIGTTNPTAAVGVGNTAVLAVGIVSAYQVYVNGSPVSGGGGGSSDSYWVQTDVGIHTLSNVGVGTTNPQNKLEVLGASKFEGNVNLPQGRLLTFGAANGGNMFIARQSGVNAIKTGNETLNFACASVHFKNATENETVAKFIQNNRVELYYDNSKKFETQGMGVTVTGRTSTTTLDVAGISTFGNDITVETESLVAFGHTASDRHNATLRLYQSGLFEIKNVNNEGDSGSGKISIQSNTNDVELTSLTNQVTLNSNGVGERLRTENAGVRITGFCTVTGALSKGSGSFRIDHPVVGMSTTHDLVHSFIEGPQADLIYRGTVDLVSGIGTVNIDTAARMTEGTFDALCTNVQCFTSNETDWTAVKGSVSGNILTITAQDSSSTATVGWMVVGERKDQHMLDTNWTDENGRVIVEPTK